MLDFHLYELQRNARRVMGETVQVGKCKDDKHYYLQDSSRNISIAGVSNNLLSWYLIGFEDAQKKQEV